MRAARTSFHGHGLAQPQRLKTSHGPCGIDVHLTHTPLKRQRRPRQTSGGRFRAPAKRLGRGLQTSRMKAAEAEPTAHEHENAPSGEVQAEQGAEKAEARRPEWAPSLPRRELEITRPHHIGKRVARPIDVSGVSGPPSAPSLRPFRCRAALGPCYPATRRGESGDRRSPKEARLARMPILEVSFIGAEPLPRGGTIGVSIALTVPSHPHGLVRAQCADS
jgi:hypothetical protein